MSTTVRKTSATEVFGELLITAGVIFLLFAFYEAYWTDIEAGQRQEQKQQQLIDAWANPRTNHSPDLGDAFAALRIPAFGSDYHYVILEGTDDDTLLAGPGHYEGTQMPGEPGNFAVAGHRVGKGAPFNDLGRLKPCDEVLVETQTEKITYRVLPMSTDPAARRAEAGACMADGLLSRVAGGDYSQVVGRHITVPSDTSVIQPHPGGGAEPAPIITLTTCHPQFSNAERMIIHAVQTGVEKK